MIARGWIEPIVLNDYELNIWHYYLILESSRKESGYIPYSEISMLWNENYTDMNLDEFCWIIKELDVVYIKHQSKRMKDGTDG